MSETVFSYDAETGEHKTAHFVWTQEWPTDEGWYWCYRLTPCAKVYVLEPCKVIQGMNSLVYIAGAQFLYEGEWDDIWFKPFPSPKLPVIEP